jgi:hypothetical protein
MNYRNLWAPALLLVFLAFILPASASERLCDVSFEDCRAQLIQLIQNENVEIDAAFWFMDDTDISGPLIKKIQAGVKVRMLVDPRADDTPPANQQILQKFAATPPPVPMRQTVAPGILHWKMMLFAGQGIVEFSGRRDHCGIQARPSGADDRRFIGIFKSGPSLGPLQRRSLVRSWCSAENYQAWWREP